jgi:GntR family transcriptional regulator
VLTVNRITHIIQLKKRKAGDGIMISFEKFIMEDGMPIYLQILQYIKRGIIAGTITDGDELPSRRMLSALLGVNPNTVQKAYRMLEDEGLISSHSGAKSYMVLNEETVAKVRGQLLEGDAIGIVLSMKQMGLSKAEAIALLENYWDKEVNP